MKERIQDLLREVEAFEPADAEDLENFRIRFLGKKGVMNELFAQFKEVPNDQKKELGQELNRLKQAAQEKHQAWQESFKRAERKSGPSFDPSLPPGHRSPGAHHPLSTVRDELVDALGRIGFTVADGPEIEDDWHNFTALNMPEDHPARDMQDTFFLEKDPEMVLRTHTSPVQIREMERRDPPLRIIAPGRVFRCDSDATHSPAFHQIEGMYIDRGVSFADLKQTLFFLVRELFGPELDLRFRPSFFPFTEPSAEMDISWKKGGKKDWMEILGCGMIDPNVLDNCGIDPQEYSGFAFGLGVERIAMLKYGIDDLRLFFENDLRFLRQFQASF
ncbi:MAG: phenylalanine--tRNA ligase subunit alpha [Flavobacteriales bacterium]